MRARSFGIFKIISNRTVQIICDISKPPSNERYRWCCAHFRSCGFIRVHLHMHTKNRTLMANTSKMSPKYTRSSVAIECARNSCNICRECGKPMAVRCVCSTLLTEILGVRCEINSIASVCVHYRRCSVFLAPWHGNNNIVLSVYSLQLACIDIVLWLLWIREQ